MTLSQKIRKILKKYMKHNCAYCQGDLLGGSDPDEVALTLIMQEIKGVVPKEMIEKRKANKNLLYGQKIREQRKGFNLCVKQILEGIE